ncbi:hypothetical protein [Demequina gelatinilytica]|uniref:hypothetical protein n=1 Tax=Demequina gelatinilytica TaxID=1638980 RepID=UPI0007847FE0|nr:hypothetical protein [Demequina gelatinilytica]
MARIRSIKQNQVAQTVHPTDVDATWAIVSTPSGQFLQLSTYGSDTRSSEPKVSQTVQIDRQVAGELRRALDAVFGSPDQP